MKRYIHLLSLCLTFALATTYSYAQNYIVYSAKGVVTKNPSMNITPGKTLAATTYIKVEEGGQLVLLEQNSMKKYTIKNSCEGTLKELLRSSDVSMKKLSTQYFKYLTGRIKSVDSSKNPYMQSTATVYREDSLLIDCPTDTCTITK